MAKSDARFGYRADLGREDHDLSQRFGFTCAPGMLLPIFTDIATPGDSYYIEHDLEFLRTKPLLSPAMIDVKVHFESFFVPFQMIYQPIEQTMYSMLNPMSNFFATSGSALANWKNNNFPLLNYATIKGDVHTLLDHSQEHADCFRISDMLGLNASAWAYDNNNASRFSYSPSFFPWQLLSYQTIWQYYYRLDDKSSFDNTYCNCDQSYDDALGFGDDQNFEIHQRPWDFDYFTSMYRSPIVSNASMQKVLPNAAYNNFNTEKTTPTYSSGGTATNNEETIVFASDMPSSYNAAVIQNGVSTALIRQMFANEKLAMITGRARKTYDSQVLAHFGVKVPHDPKHDITLIGHDTYKLHIGEVTSLAESSTTPLGELAGKAWATGKGNKHKFVAPCHGAIMTIFSVEPMKRYYGGFDRINAVTTAFDIPQPEFDKLGNVPMYRYEAGENAGSGAVTATDIIGWKERYYWNKRKHDKVSLAFMVPRTSLGTNAYAAYMISSAPFGAYTSTNNNTARPDLESRFYVDRNCMDGLFLLPFINNWQTGGSGEETSENWNKNPYLAYHRDPFIVDSFMKVKKVSWMSKDGEPIYNF